jgi:error-prone DNA polymerase
LADADAFQSLGLSRRQALWLVMNHHDEPMPLFENLLQDDDTSVSLPRMPIQQEVKTDYRISSLSLKAHPVGLVRDILSAKKIITAAELGQLPQGRWVKVAGLVLIRQRPGTASGIVFETLEDETGVVNLIIRPDIYDRYRPAARHSALVQADGYVEKSGQVIHVMAKRLFDLSHLVSGHEVRSRDFH